MKYSGIVSSLVMDEVNRGMEEMVNNTLWLDLLEHTPYSYLARIGIAHNIDDYIKEKV